MVKRTCLRIPYPPGGYLITDLTADFRPFEPESHSVPCLQPDTGTGPEEITMLTPRLCAALLISVIVSWYALPATLEAG